MFSDLRRRWLASAAAAVLLSTCVVGNPPVEAAGAQPQCSDSVFYDNSTNGATKLLTGGAATRIYICGYTMLAAGTVNLDLRYGTGTNCGTGGTKITPAYQFTTQTGIVDPSPTFRGLYVPTGKDLCVNASVGVAAQVLVYYTVEP